MYISNIIHMGSSESRVQDIPKPKSFNNIKDHISHVFAHNNKKSFTETSICETVACFNDTATYKPKPCCNKNYSNKKYHRYDPAKYKQYLMGGGAINSVTESSIEKLSENSNYCGFNFKSELKLYNQHKYLIEDFSEYVKDGN